MQTKYLILLPNLAQHIILEFLDYKLRNGKYIRQLPKDLPIYNYILNRQQVIEKCYDVYDFMRSKNVFPYENERGYVYYGDVNGFDKYYLISLVVNGFRRKYWTETTIDILYSYSDRNIYEVTSSLYDYDYDGFRENITEY